MMLFKSAQSCQSVALLLQCFALMLFVGRQEVLLLVFCCSNSRSMAPITWQAAVDDEEQRPLLQHILEAAVDDRQQAAVDVEEQRPQLQDIFEAAGDGNHV